MNAERKGNDDFEALYRQVLLDSGVESWVPLYWRWFCIHALFPSPVKSALNSHVRNTPQCEACLTVQEAAHWPLMSARKRYHELYEATQRKYRPQRVLCWNHFEVLLREFESKHPVPGFRSNATNREWDSAQDWLLFQAYAFKWCIVLRCMPFLVQNFDPIGLTMYFACNRHWTIVRAYDFEAVPLRVQPILQHADLVGVALGESIRVKNPSRVESFVFRHLKQVGLSFVIQGERRSDPPRLLCGFINLLSHSCVHHNLILLPTGRGVFGGPDEMAVDIGTHAAVSYGLDVMGKDCLCPTCTSWCVCHRCDEVRRKRASSKKTSPTPVNKDVKDDWICHGYFRPDA